jgi:tryptophanyl-tRNA synthetase
MAGRAEARNLVGIYAALSGTDHAAVLSEFGGKGFGTFKEALTGLLVDRITPIGRETKRRLADPVGLDLILREGAARAEAIADPILAEVERLVGLVRA